jgi:two-component system, NtrC family, nitrogen regulation response regulator NtrX
VPTVLCIDDDPRTLAIREAILHAEGFQVFSATEGFEGIALANEHNFDAIVLDYAMPDIDGEEVATALKLAHPEVPIVLCSGEYKIPDSVFKLVDAFVTKGDAPTLLVKTVRSLIERKSSGNQGLN